MRPVPAPPVQERPVRIPAGGVILEGDLGIPQRAKGIVLFVHGSGSSRHSRRNRQVAATLREAGLATLLTDLLTPDEERLDDETAELRFNIPLLTERVIGIVDWLVGFPQTRPLHIGCFGASTGGGAALLAASCRPLAISAVVSRGGRPDLAGDKALEHVKAPTLLIVGGEDEPVIRINRMSFEHLRCPKRLDIIPGATHLFEEPGTLEEVARLSTEWFLEHLPR